MLQVFIVVIMRLVQVAVNRLQWLNSASNIISMPSFNGSDQGKPERAPPTIFARCTVAQALINYGGMILC